MRPILRDYAHVLVIGRKGCGCFGKLKLRIFGLDGRLL